MEKFTEMLEKIASQLGMVANEAWPHLVRQTYLAGVLDLALSLVFAAVGAVSCRHGVAFAKNYDGFSIPCFILAFIASVAAIVFFYSGVLSVCEPVARTITHLMGH